MIIYPQSFVLAAAVSAAPLNYTRIGWKNFLAALNASAITAAETAAGPKDAPLRPDSAEYWKPPSLPATWLADMQQSRTVDFVGITGHTIGSCGAAVKVQLDSDPTVPDPHLSLPGISGNYASTPDAAPVDLTGNIEIRAKLAAADYTPASNQTIFAKWNPTGNQQSVSFDIDTTGKLILRTSPNGSTVRTHTSSVATGLVNLFTKYWKVSRDAASGVVKFWMSDDNITYVQLGANVAGFVEGIFASSAPVEIGSNSLGTANRFIGKIFYAEYRNGIPGVAIAVFDPSTAADGAASLVASTGETWTVNTSGGIPARLNNNILAYEYAPADDTPLLLLFAARTGRYFKLTVTGSGAVPRIASIYTEVALVMETLIVDPFVPINMAKEQERRTFVSRGGQFLGQSTRSKGVTAPVTFRYMTTAWVRANFLGFCKNAGVPYFMAWNPLSYQTDIGYVWHNDPIKPSYSGIRDLMEAAWEMHGIGVP